VILVGSAAVAILPRAGLRGRESVLLTGLIAALVGHVVTDWFMTADLSGSWLFWVLMGAGIALIDHTTRDGEPVRPGNRRDP
jgi:hypothetical protein